MKISMDHLPISRKEQDRFPPVLEDGLLKAVPRFMYDLLLAMINKSVDISVIKPAFQSI